MVAAMPSRPRTAEAPGRPGPAPGEGAQHLAGLVDSLLLIGARIGANLLALVWTVLLVRLLGAEGAGLALQAISVAQIASILVTLNVESGAMRAIVPARAEGRMDRAAAFIRFNRRIMLATVPALGLAVLLAWAAGVAPGWPPSLLAAMLPAVVLVALARLSARHATALGVMRKGLLPRLLTGPVVLTAVLGLARLAGWPLAAWHVVMLFALSEGLTVLIQNLLLRSDFAFLRENARPPPEPRRWIALGLWLSPGLVMAEYRKAILIATAGLVLSDAETGMFAVAFSIVNILNFGVNAVDIAFSPRIAAAMAAHAPRLRDRLLASSAAIKLAGLGIGTLLVFALGRTALGWFGPGFQAAWPALMTLLLMPAISVLFGPGSVLLSSGGQGRADFAANLVAAVACVAAICVLGLRLGMTGAALGAALAHLAGQATCALLCARRLRTDPTLMVLRRLRGGPAHPGRLAGGGGRAAPRGLAP